MKAYFIIKMIDEYAGLALFILVAIILAIRIFISYIQNNRKAKYLFSIGFRQINSNCPQTTSGSSRGWKRDDGCFIEETDLLKMSYKDLKKKFPI